MQFKVYKGKLGVDDVRHTDLQTLLDEDISYLLYVFFYKDLSKDNPLRNLRYTEKEKEARFRAFGDYKYKIPVKMKKKVARAIATYEGLLSDQQIELNTYDKKMDQFGTLLLRTTPRIERNENENTGMISYSTNIDIINSILKDITNIIQAKASLMALYVQGSLPKHLRGRLSPLSKGKLKT